MVAGKPISCLAITKPLNSVLNNRTVPDRKVAITFDDGYRGVYDNAFPLLKNYGFPFTLFISTQSIDGNYKSHITWNQIREMSVKGATIEKHTVSHPYLKRL